jgi:hypothetical protein
MRLLASQEKFLSTGLGSPTSIYECATIAIEPAFSILLVQNNYHTMPYSKKCCDILDS